jgi:hypothetical protein
LSKNSNLHKAKKEKFDEFYTQISDIEKELQHYTAHFENKIVFLNCDDPQESNFFKYFALNFEKLKLKKLISTHFKTDKPSYKLEITEGLDLNGDGKLDLQDIVTTPLKQNGDFRSDECIELLKEADIIVTNPPFSLFREYIVQLIEYRKEFLVMGNNNSITYKDIFKLIKENKLWLGYTSNKTMEFKIPDEYEKWDRIDEKGNKYGNVPAITWFTNLKHEKRNEELILYKEYNEKEYSKYENYDAINIDQVKEIPVNYQGIMGVPITVLGNYNPKQFEIIALGIVGSCEFICNKKMEILNKKGEPTGKFTKNAKGTLYIKYSSKEKKPPAFKDFETGELYSSRYARILIKKREKTNG